MSNLGGYQILTTVAKRVGGPTRLAIYTAVGGYFVLRIIEASGKIVYKRINDSKVDNYRSPQEEYIIISDGVDTQGVVFKVGDIIKILDTLPEGVLIEKVGDKDNPYVVSFDFLKTVISSDCSFSL